MSDIVERLQERARGGYAHDALDEEAAEEIERLRANLNGRDDFIVDKGLWSEFMDTLPRPRREGE